MGAIPLPSKQTVEEHNRTQSKFLKEKLEPVLAQAKAKQRSVFFADAAHFVQGSFLCCVRMFVRGSSGRRRYNVLGAWNGITRELIRVSNDTRVSSDTMIELLRLIAAQTVGLITVVLDNARYQRCEAVEIVAERLKADAGELVRSHRIATGFGFNQLRQCLDDLRIFFVKGGRPPPGFRMRSVGRS